MAFGLSKTRCTPIGIDFGADSLKLLQIVPTDPPQLVGAACAVLPEEARTDAEARFAFLGEALRHLLGKQPFKGRRALLCIPAFQTLVQHVQIGRFDQNVDIEGQVRLQLQQRLNADPTRLVIRHYPVGQVVRDGASVEEVVCIAARRESVMRYISLANRVKLDVIGMQSEPVCMLAAFRHLYMDDDAKQRSTCFIDIGAATTKVVIAHGADMAFAKSIHAAGDQMTRHYARTRQMSFTDARQSRVSHAVGAPAKAEAPVSQVVIPSGTDFEDDPSSRERAAREANVESKINRETLDCIIDELRLCLRYHSSLYPGRSVDRLVFLGGEARHVPFCQEIARTVRIAAQLGDPFARLTRIGRRQPAHGVNLDQPQPGWAVPLGLCLTAPSD